jgi:hypothetical protein
MVQILRHMTRLIAGVIVPDTPLINASIALAQENLPTNGFNHVMRAWLNGQAIINHLPTDNRSVIDVEAFGVATILHDLGWYVPTLLPGPLHLVISIQSMLMSIGHSIPASCPTKNGSKSMARRQREISYAMSAEADGMSTDYSSSGMP